MPWRDEGWAPGAAQKKGRQLQHDKKPAGFELAEYNAATSVIDWEEVGCNRPETGDSEAHA